MNVRHAIRVMCRWRWPKKFGFEIASALRGADRQLPCDEALDVLLLTARKNTGSAVWYWSVVPTRRSCGDSACGIASSDRRWRQYAKWELRMQLSPTRKISSTISSGLGKACSVCAANSIELRFQNCQPLPCMFNDLSRHQDTASCLHQSKRTQCEYFWGVEMREERPRHSKASGAAGYPV